MICRAVPDRYASGISASPQRAVPDRYASGISATPQLAVPDPTRPGFRLRLNVRFPIAMRRGLSGVETRGGQSGGLARGVGGELRFSIFDFRFSNFEMQTSACPMRIGEGSGV